MPSFTMPHRFALAAIFLILAAVSARPSLAAPDNLLGAFSDPIRLMHMFTAADGLTHTPANEVLG